LIWKCDEKGSLGRPWGWYEENIKMTWTEVGCLDVDGVLIGLGDD
jgi:hypothetical protein